MIQSTAAIAPGSSGGPLFNRDGQVIGVTTSLMSDSPGIYFSIGAGDVSRLLRAPALIVMPFPSQSIGSPAGTKPGPQTKGLYVSSEPLGASVFINGLKQGQTPLALPLQPGQYNLVLRLPGHAPYAGRVEVVDKAQTQLTVTLEKQSVVESQKQIDGTYEGRVHNSTANVTASFSIAIRRDKQTIFGCMIVQRPLYGSGPLRGVVDGDGVSFDTNSPMFQIKFQGRTMNGRITGTYRVTRPVPQVGDFELERESSEVSTVAFDPSECPTD